MPLRLRCCAFRLYSRGRPCGHPRRAALAAPRYRRPGCAGGAIPAHQRHFILGIQPMLSIVDCMGVPGQETWPVALSCCASNPLRGFAPDGLPSFPRSARLTPTARIPRSGPARFACVRFGTQGRPLPCPAVSPDFITFSATVAPGRVPSRRAGPCPRCAAGRTNPALVSLTAPVRALLWPRAMNSGKTVATGPTGFLVPTAQNSRKAGLPNLGIRCAV